VNKIQDTNLVCPSGIAQHAALAAAQVGGAHAKPALPGLDRTRQAIFRELTLAGLPCDIPESTGAFYYFIRVHADIDSMRLAERLIREHRVAVMPGSAFGAVDGCYVRVAYGALDEQSVTEGVSRLVSGLRAIAGSAVRK
jgi:aspartate/methionine/tyrosine aminotransferase